MSDGGAPAGIICRQLDIVPCQRYALRVILSFIILP